MSARKEVRQGMYRLRLAEDWTQECRVRWSARRTLALQVDSRGVHVFAPHDWTLARLEEFVRSRRDWLRKHLAKPNRAAPPAAPAPAPEENVAHGSEIALLGATARIHRASPFRRPRWGEDADGTPLLLLPFGLTDEQARYAVDWLLAERALPYFTERVHAYCAQLQLAPPPVRITRARKLWGSCSARSGIRLNLRLMRLAPHLTDYVAAHEVAHLLEMNHSPRFWAVVTSLYPDWKAARRELRKQQ